MKKILIVEDDRELKEGICYALQKAGYLTESADSVQNAKKLFLKEGADVILLDVNLPDGEGFDFCKWVKERAQVPVLFLTEYEDQSRLLLRVPLQAFYCRDRSSPERHLFREHSCKNAVSADHSLPQKTGPA